MYSTNNENLRMNGPIIVDQQKLKGAESVLNSSTNDARD